MLSFFKRDYTIIGSGNTGRTCKYVLKIDLRSQNHRAHVRRDTSLNHTDWPTKKKWIVIQQQQKSKYIAVRLWLFFLHCDCDRPSECVCVCVCVWSRVCDCVFACVFAYGCSLFFCSLVSHVMIVYCVPSISFPTHAFSYHTHTNARNTCSKHDGFRLTK